MNPSIQSEWDTFTEKVIPLDTPTLQRVEMRRAFYAGALATLGIAYQLGSEDIDEEAGAATLESLQQECIEFFENEIQQNNNQQKRRNGNSSSFQLVMAD